MPLRHIGSRLRNFTLHSQWEEPGRKNLYQSSTGTVNTFVTSADECINKEACDLVAARVKIGAEDEI